MIFNTTYTISNAEARNFVIWVHQVYIPKSEETGLLGKARMLRVLSHKDEETECFSLQFDVENTSNLHKWFTQCGQQLAAEMTKMFGEEAVGFSTLLEEIEGE